MSVELLSSDVAVLDLLRKRDTMSVAELAQMLQVTATAARQRLVRVMAQGYVQRASAKSSRGRPAHRYSLTDKGRRKTGANFADLAIALWHEIRAIKDPEVRRGLFQRISRRLVDLYADQIVGTTIEEKMESVGELFGERQVPVTVDSSGELPVLTVWACPYPQLAEQDRTICAMERMMLSDLLGQNVRLDKCRLDEGSCCTFELN